MWSEVKLENGERKSGLMDVERKSCEKGQMEEEEKERASTRKSRSNRHSRNVTPLMPQPLTVQDGKV